MPKSIIFLDIDGCLISDSGNVDDNYYKSLARIARYIRGANVCEHPNICLCSGRSAIFTEAISFLIGWPHFPAIVENGAGFFDLLTKEFRFNPEIPLKTRNILKNISVRAIPQILKKYPILYLFQGQQANITFAKKSIENALSIEKMRDGIRRFIAKPVKKRLLKTIIAGNSISIVPAGVNKGKALELLAKEQGLDLKKCCGIGDSRFDISFLEKIGFAGCPQNADKVCKDFVKEKGGRVSPYYYAEGVVNILEWFNLMK